MTQTATGINLSAFGQARRPVLATASLGDRGDVRVELQPAEMFGGKHKLSDKSEEVFAVWRAGLLELPRPIAVDVAIDIDVLGMGGTRRAPAERMLWELTHRPIDFAFYGDAPLTDRISEFGVRFRALLAASAFQIGNDIFECYPRATVELMEFRGQYLGGSAHHGGTGWKADDRNKRADKLMAKLLSELGANAGQGAEKLDSDDLDATLCALTALAATTGQGLLGNDELDHEVAERAARRGNAEVEPQHTAPGACAVLARPFWESLSITRR
ncbi:MAG: DUF429 domain-containing protein [Planctomycetes bacterium]|nr:DUF429 domain-containing protein [Planctomycetota bacterium]